MKKKSIWPITPAIHREALFSVLAIFPDDLAKSIVDHNGDGSSLPSTFHFDSAYSPQLPLFILVASRPETPIRNSFNSYDLQEMIHKVILDESSEIRRFLSLKFKQIQ